MNRLVFAAAAYLLLALQRGLEPAWSLGGVTPNLLLILGVFIGVSANRSTVLIAMLILGLLLDLQPGPTRGSDAIILGPHAVGLLIGGYALLQLRGMLFRESVVTIVVMVLVVGGFTALVEAVVYTFRGLPWLANDPLAWSLTQQLWDQSREIGYTALAAIPLGLLLQATRRWWGFTGRGKHERVF